MKKITFLLLMIFMSVSMNSQYVVDFEDVISRNYASDIVDLSGIEWDFQEALVGSLDNDWKNGERSARLRGWGNTNLTMIEDKTDGIGEVTFLYRRYGTDNQVEYVVEISTDQGNSWSQIGDEFTAPDTDEVQTFSASVEEENDARIRIRTTSNTGTTNRRLNIDDITITDFDGTLSRKSFEEVSFNLYPNPVTNGVLNIEVSSDETFEVEFYNMLGQRVLTSKTSKNMNVSSLNAGVYLVKINQGNSSTTKKVIVK